MLTITASDLPRVMQCNGSLLLEKDERFDFNSDMTVRNEGNAVHYMISAGLRREFAPIELIDRKAPNGIFITSEMADFVDWYFENLQSLTGFYEETETSYSVNENVYVAGRADYIFHNVAASVLHVNDFKYGWRIVEPVMNWTMISHAIGFCRLHEIAPATIEFSIFQPRPYHPSGPIRKWSISYAELTELWVKIQDVLGTLTNQLITGPACAKCPSIGSCPAATVAAMNSIDVSESAFSDTLEPNELSYIIDQLKYAEKTIKNKLKAFEELAAHRLKKGEIIPNYSLQSSLSNKQWKPGATPEILQALTGLDLSKKSLVTPTQAIKMKASETIVNAMSERVSTGFSLQRIDANTRAHQLFNPKGN